MNATLSDAVDTAMILQDFHANIALAANTAVFLNINAHLMHVCASQNLLS
jgi:hypothetical protein